jgi:cytochrome b561
MPTPNTPTLNPRPRYGSIAIALHWVLALAIAGTFCFGLYMADLPFSPQRLKLYNYHKWAGMCILGLSLLRLLWRLTHRPPALGRTIESTMPGWQMTAFHATHGLMYLLFFAVPVIGWAYSSAAGFSITLFGVFPIPDFVGKDKELAEMIKPWHEIAAWSLAALVGLHVLAALKHQFVDRDGLIQRMLPGRG